MEFLLQLVDISKLSGWVRATVASAGGVAVAKWPGLSGYLSPDAQAALGALAGSIIVGVWSQVAKSMTINVAKLADATPGVKAVVLQDQAMADSIPGNKVIGPEQVHTLVQHHGR